MDEKREYGNCLEKEGSGEIMLAEACRKKKIVAAKESKMLSIDLLVKFLASPFLLVRLSSSILTLLLYRTF